MNKLFNNKIREKIKFFFHDKKASALIMSLFILSGMLVMALSGSSLIVINIKTSGIQSKSIKAYFAAEAGAEKTLWEIRKNDYDLVSSASPIVGVFSDNLGNDSSYEVDYDSFIPIVFIPSFLALLYIGTWSVAHPKIMRYFI